MKDYIPEEPNCQKKLSCNGFIPFYTSKAAKSEIPILILFKRSSVRAKRLYCLLTSYPVRARAQSQLTEKLKNQRLTDILPGDIRNFRSSDRVGQNFVEVFQRRLKIVDAQFHRRRKNVADGGILSPEASVALENGLPDESSKVFEEKAGSLSRNSVQK